MFWQDSKGSRQVVQQLRSIAKIGDALVTGRTDGASLQL